MTSSSRNERFPLLSLSDPTSCFCTHCFGWGLFASLANQKLDGEERCGALGCLFGSALPCASAWGLRRRTSERYGFDESAVGDCAASLLCPCAAIDEANREIDFYENRAEVRRAKQGIYDRMMTPPGGMRGFRR